MVRPAPDRPLMTVDEYLAFESESPTKHEYVAGEVYAMSGVTMRHARIVTNLFLRLGTAARGGPCEVIVLDVKLRPAHDRFYYPDLMVLCTRADDEDSVVRDPCLVVEVTSPSTARLDRGEKLEAYKTVASLQAYLIVDHRLRRVERHWRDATGEWRRDDIGADGTVSIPCPELVLSLDEIYEGVQPAGFREEESEYEYEAQ